MTMKNYLRRSAIFAAFCILTGGAAAICPAQAGMMVGGYREVAKTDETVVDAANAAVDARAEVDASLKLVSIERAELQIVAGSNYRLCLTTNSNDKRQEATAVMFLSLENEFTLTSWTPGKWCRAKQLKRPLTTPTIRFPTKAGWRWENSIRRFFMSAKKRAIRRCFVSPIIQPSDAPSSPPVKTASSASLSARSILKVRAKSKISKPICRRAAE